MYSYVTRMPLVCTRISSVYHSYVLVCHPYITSMYSYVIRMSLVCTRMSPACHSYILVCHPYITRMCWYVIRRSLVCTRMWSVCHSYVLVCHPYVTRMYSYVIRISLVCGFNMNLVKVNVYFNVSATWTFLLHILWSSKVYQIFFVHSFSMSWCQK